MSKTLQAVATRSGIPGCIGEMYEVECRRASTFFLREGKVFMRAASPLLTLSSAVLYALSFPPFSLWPLAWIALVPLLLALTFLRPAVAFAYGLLWGVAMTCGVAWCLPTMLSNYFHWPAAAGWGGLFLAGVGLAGVYYGAFAWWISWLAQRRTINPLLVAAGWGVCEFARANPMIGSPWALSAYSQISLTSLMQIADATGPYGVGMLIAAVNACLAGWLVPSLRGRRPLFSFVSISALLSLAFGYGEWRLSQTFTTGEPVEVAVIQAAIERPLRWDPEHREANLGRYLALTKEVAAAHPRLVFWPENAVDFYMQEQVPEREAILSVARDLKVDLILGGPYYGHGVSDIYYHNSVFLIRKGRLAGRYDKIYLLPFAETDQLRELFPRALLNYKPGRLPLALRAEDIRVGAFVCFEAMYPGLVRKFALQGAEVLVNPSNDDWFGAAAPARHLLDIASVRAIENRRYLVRPTSTGFSAVIDPYGHVTTLSGFGTPEVLTASVTPSRALTPYQRWGDAVSWLALACVTAVSLFHIDWRGYNNNRHNNNRHNNKGGKS